MQSIKRSSTSTYLISHYTYSTLQSWRRSYDDGDITPTNDAARELMYEEGGGTLPRQQRGILQRAVLNSMPPLEHHYMNAAVAAEYVCHAGGLGGVGVPGAAAHVGAAGPTGCVLDSAGLNAVSHTAAYT